MSEKKSTPKIQNINTVLGVAAVSSVLGFLLFVASIILLDEIKPNLDECHDPHPTRTCYPVYGDGGASVLGIILGLFQMIIVAVSLFRRATCSPHTILGSQFAVFILSLILFSLTVYNDSSLIIQSLKEQSGALSVKLLFFYASSAINCIFSLIAVIFANRCL